MVGRRGEAPLVSPYILCNFKLDGAVASECVRDGVARLTRWPVAANAPDLREASELLMESWRLKFTRQTFDDATRLPRSPLRGDAFALG